MAGSDVSVPLSALKRSQNADGGWGYYPGKASWLEPTFYSTLALLADPPARDAVERAWSYMRSLQRPDGAWQPAAGVPVAHWTTALAVTWHAIRGRYDDGFHRGVAWLLQTEGSEGRLFTRVIHFLKPRIIEYDGDFQGWPWRAGSSSWVEPTAHSLFALKKASAHISVSRLRSRIDEGERMLLDRRCTDNAWNYGNRRVLGENLVSYGETTALALHGLQGNRSPVIRQSINRALEHRRTTRSALARAWLSITLQNYGALIESGPVCRTDDQDILLAALNAIAGSDARRLLALEATPS